MSSETDAVAKQERVPSAVRREQILAAASRVFGERGYVGATTDQVAREAGISQPYVVRMFGGKENLFVAVLDRGLGKLLDAFTGAMSEARAQGDTHQETLTRMGSAYADLIRDRGILLSLMQAFIAAGLPAKFLGLSHVGGETNDLAAIRLFEPSQYHRRVESPGVREHHLFDCFLSCLHLLVLQIRSYLGHNEPTRECATRLPATARAADLKGAKSLTIFLIASRCAAAFLTAIKIVSSPATVPTISPRLARSIVKAAG